MQVETLINKTLNKSIVSVRLTSEMKQRLAPLEKKFKENEKLLTVAEVEVKEAVNISSKSKTVSMHLNGPALSENEITCSLSLLSPQIR